MDTDLMLAQWAEVKSHLAHYEIAIARQRQLITELEQANRDATEARALLRRAEDLQAKLSQEHDRLQAELAKCADASGPQH
jgi:hypothetical protein